MDLFHTVPSVLLSSQEIYHKSDECPPTPAGRHCRNDLSVQYVQTGACCTGREKNYNYKTTTRTKIIYTTNDRSNDFTVGK